MTLYGDSSTPRCQWCNRPRHDGRCPSYIAGVEAECDRLREALENVAGWDSTIAAKNGHVGVREYARRVLDA